MHKGIYFYATRKTISPVILRCWAVGVSWRPWDLLGMIHRKTVGVFVVYRQRVDFCFKFVAPFSNLAPHSRRPSGPVGYHVHLLLTIVRKS